MFLPTEVLVDLTEGPPPQKKIWPEVKEAEDAPPPANAKAKSKADKDKKKKLIDVRNKLYVIFDICLVSCWCGYKSQINSDDTLLQSRVSIRIIDAKGF